ncbi:MAG: hypothetical protein ACRD0B_10705 [Acidimicrobiales bacterium]
MSSLWTPHGEHRVPRGEEPPGDEGPVAGGGTAATGGGVPRSADASARPVSGPGGEPSAEELAALTEELAGAPAADIVANHCFGLFELAALHLSQKPPHLDDARLAIDAFGAVVDGLGDRLGAEVATLRQALSQIRLAYVKIADALPENAAPAGEAG